MPAYRILNLEPNHYSAQARAILSALGEVVDRPLTRAELLTCLPEFDILIVRLGQAIDAQVLARGKRLKVIVSATTGLNHIDMQYAEKAGIQVLSLRGETAFLRSIPATAEHTWALLLSLVRQVPSAFQSVLTGEWDRDRFRGHDLAGRTLGILGLGRIGEKVAAYARAFSMQVLAYDPYREIWPEDVEQVESMQALLARSQVLSIHVPLNPQTTLLLGATELDQLPDGSVLINTSRGEVLDEQALAAALESGHLAGAAVDVLQDEVNRERVRSLLIDYARSHSNLIITPHLGGATVESMAATEVFMAQKLVKYIQETMLE